MGGRGHWGQLGRAPAPERQARRQGAGGLARAVRRRWLLALGSLLLLSAADGITLDELQKDTKLTPKRFASHFTDFKYVYHADVQKPEVFLATRAGDCDDYAILADLVLKPKGFTTHLVSVRMPGQVAHVVCYVTQEKGYLDYNNREYIIKTQRCAPSLRAIAGKVAKSLDANWTSASEFTYGAGVKRLVNTVVKTDPPERDPPLGKVVPGQRVDF